MKIIYFLILSGILFSCGPTSNEKSNKQDSKWLHLTGNAQGTTFSIKYEDENGRDFTKEVKEIFDEMDQQLSTYIDSSLISKINEYDGEYNGDTPSSDYFLSVLVLANNIYNITEGIFNPMIFPLVEYWGFGKKAESPDQIDKGKIQELLKYTTLDSISYGIDDDHFFIKKSASSKFDFNGIAQGYTVDVIADFLEKQGVENYMIEIGGETRMKGKNDRGSFWNMGIEKPTDMNEDHILMATIQVKDRSMATSGSYRKFYEKDGVRYSHTIDPKTGYPVQHSLLSATVLAPDCASADAFATVFMVMGVERTKVFLKGRPELKLDVYLIYNENGKFKTWASDGIEKLIQEKD